MIQRVWRLIPPSVFVLVSFLLVVFFLERHFESVDLRARRETRALLDEEHQRALLTQLASNEGLWLLTTATSPSGLPYWHGLMRFRGKGADERCEARRAYEQARGAQLARSIGPHYILFVSECRPGGFTDYPEGFPPTEKED